MKTIMILILMTIGLSGFSRIENDVGNTSNINLSLNVSQNDLSVVVLPDFTQSNFTIVNPCPVFVMDEQPVVLQCIQSDYPKPINKFLMTSMYLNASTARQAHLAYHNIFVSSNQANTANRYGGLHRLDIGELYVYPSLSYK